VINPVIWDSGATYTPGISEKRNNITTYLHGGLKDKTLQTGSSGATVASRQYDAFGMVTNSTGTWKGPFGYSGGAGYQEDETGLQLLGHRYYDPSTGRFLTRDPIKDGRNWYSYCDNNPVNCIDADGLKKKLVVLIGDITGYGLFYLYTKIILTALRANFSDEYEIQIIWDVTSQQCSEALSNADAIAYIGHGSGHSWQLRDDETDGNATFEHFEMAYALSRRKKTLDIALCFSCDSMGIFETFSPYCYEFMGYHGKMHVNPGRYLFNDVDRAAGSANMGRPRKSKNSSRSKIVTSPLRIRGGGLKTKSI
jgi:RHS repeat-associated protein